MYQEGEAWLPSTRCINTHKCYAVYMNSCTYSS
jgi:hypothetical protein